MPKTFSSIFPALLVAAALALNICWTGRNFAYQENDAGYYMLYGHQVYTTLKKDGIAAALSHAYFERDWKPLLGPNLIVPFLVVNDGDTRAAFQQYSLVISIAILLGLYFLLLGLTGSAVTSFLGALLIASTSWMITDFIEFGSEAPWLAFSIWYYHLLFRRGTIAGPGMASTFMLAFSIMCRPVESALCLVPPFMWLIRRGQTRAMLLEAAIACAVIAFPYYILHENLPKPVQLGLLATIGAYFIFTINIAKERKAWSVLVFAVLFWFMPNLSGLMTWIDNCTSGVMVTGAAFHSLNERFFPALFFERMGYFFGALLLFLPLTFREALARFRSNPFLFSALIWAGGAFASVGAFTESRDFRYYHISFVSLAIVLILFGLSVQVWKRRLLQVLLAVTTSLMAYGSLTQFFVPEEGELGLPYLAKLQPLSGDATRGLSRQKEAPLLEFFEFLRQLKLPNSARFFFIDNNYIPLHGKLNQLKFDLRASELGLRWRFERFHDFQNNRDFFTRIESLRKSYDYFLVGPPSPETAEPGELDEITRFLYTCSPAECRKHGFEKFGEFMVDWSARHPAVKYLLFKPIQIFP